MSKNLVLTEISQGQPAFGSHSQMVKMFIKFKYKYTGFIVLHLSSRLLLSLSQTHGLLKLIKCNDNKKVYATLQLGHLPVVMA